MTGCWTLVLWWVRRILQREEVPALVHVPDELGKELALMAIMAGQASYGY